jgi:hypothetical protein
MGSTRLFEVLIGPEDHEITVVNQHGPGTTDPRRDWFNLDLSAELTTVRVETPSL